MTDSGEGEATPDSRAPTPTHDTIPDVTTSNSLHPPDKLLNAIGSYVSDLAEDTNRAWKAFGYDEQSFSEIAYEALVHAQPAATLNAAAITSWLAQARTVPAQAKTDESFGQPAITLHHDEHMRIDALFWHTAATGIHQHAFAGAFAVVEGSSVHCRYGFTAEHAEHPALTVGSLALKTSELLAVGAVREIGYGGTLIHSVFHLGAPSVSLVMRTNGDRAPGPEYVYHPPGIALDPHPRDAVAAKQLQMLRLLLATGSAQLGGTASTVLERCDVHTAYQLLLTLRTHGADEAIYRESLHAAQHRFGHLVAPMATAIEEQRRRHRILACRHTVIDSEPRFLLALLLSLLSRRGIHDMVARHYPGEPPVERIAQWLARMPADTDIALAVAQANPQLLRLCLLAPTDDEILTRLSRTYGPADIAGKRADILTACRHIRSDPVLHPLFSD